MKNNQLVEELKNAFNISREIFAEARDNNEELKDSSYLNENQPLISTKVKKKILGNSNEIHYIPRTVKEGESIVCHFNKMFT